MDLLLPHVQCVTVSNIVHVSRIIRAVVSVVGEYAAALQRPATGVTALMCPSPATQSGQWFFSSAVTVTLHQHRHLHQPLARATASSSRRLIGEELQIPGELIPEESCCLLDVFRERGAFGGGRGGILDLSHSLILRPCVGSDIRLLLRVSWSYSGQLSEKCRADGFAAGLTQI